MNRKRWIPMVAATLVVCLIAAGASASTRSTKHAQKTAIFKIGHLTSLTGSISAFGVTLQQAFNLQVSQINAKGGFKVGNTQYKIAVTTVDDRSDQATSIAGATQLIRDDHINVIFGPIGPLAPAVAQLTQQSHVIQFTASSASAANAGTPGYKQLFAVLPDLNTRIRTTIEGIKVYAPHVKRIGIFAADDQTGAATVGPLTTALKKAGYTVINAVYPAGTSDLSAVATKLASQNPDLVLMGWLAQDRANQMKQIDAAGVSKSAPVFLYAGNGNECALAGGRQCIYDPLEPGDITAAHPPKALKAIGTAFLAQTHTSKLPNTSQVITWYWDPLNLLIAAMQKAGTTTNTTKIAAALPTVEIHGVVGPVSFVSATNSIKQGLEIFSKTNGYTASAIFH